MMAAIDFELDSKALDKLQEEMKRVETPGPIIDEVLHGQGAELIKEKISLLIPRSGRKWKGKGAAAASAMPRSFQQENASLSVTIAARGKYGYLYFPDDGTNTHKHAGNQQFMRRGAEAASDRVIEMCVGKLLESFGG